MVGVTGGAGRIVVCVKWVDLRPTVDGLTGEVSDDPRGYGFSAADLAAVEVALSVAAAWSDGTGGAAPAVEVVCASESGSEDALRQLLAAGVRSATRIDLGPDEPSEHVAAAIAASVGDVDLVVCGEHSVDRGSGSVPAFVAHHLGAAQALGLVGVEVTAAGRLEVRRRLGGGRTERVDVPTPAVISVEGSVAELRRAPLRSILATRDAEVNVVPGARAHLGRGGSSAVFEPPVVTRFGPYRPRARELPAPAGATALDRIVHLTGALVDRTPPRTVELEPGPAAEAILEQLRAWGAIG